MTREYNAPKSPHCLPTQNVVAKRYAMLGVSQHTDENERKFQRYG